MINFLKVTYIKLLQDLDIDTYRYLYKDLDLLSNRLSGIIGQRGTGKTTLMLQYIKNNIKDYDDAFYVSLDHIYFNKTTVLEFVQTMYQREGVKIFFLDEVHRYKNWDQELKNIYDSFPDVRIVFSGSSKIDLVRAHDLSRRAVIYDLQGMSFREYLNFKTEKEYEPLGFNDIIDNYKKISYELSRIDGLGVYFKEYLEYGYYPFVFEGKEFYFQKLLRVIEKIVFEDIANSHSLNTANLINFKKILYFLVTIPPGKMNIHNLAKSLGIDDKTTRHYIKILEDTGLISLIFLDKGGAALVRNPEKIMVDNTSLYHAICYGLGHEVNVGMLRELFFINAVQSSGERVFYSKSIGDFICNGINFEIGGRGKTRKQIKEDIDNSFVVQDDLLVASERVIPLYLFGFLY